MANEKRLDLIDRQAFIEDIKAEIVNLRLDGLKGTPRPCDELSAFIDRIEAQPGVDAVEVVHGRWIYHECVSSFDGAISGYSCSECNAFVKEEDFDMDEFHKDFCGNCGAKMDGGNEDV